MSEIELHLGRTVTPGGVLSNSIVQISNGRITGLREGGDPGENHARLWAVPGFVDTHSHGGAGADFASTDPDAVARAIELHRRHGSTSIFASTVTESIPELVAQLGRLRPLVEAGELAGIHLEGPFLSHDKRGAHNPELLRDPTPDVVAPLIEAGGPALSMITMAPELENALQATQSFTSNGVVVAFGHSDADDAMTKAGIDAGASVATHLFNAMRPIHHREPGPVPDLLADSRVMVELICDGVHLHKDVARLAIDAAGPDRVALVTDAMSATGLSDRDCMLGTLAVQVRDGVARLATPDGSPGAIAGSTLTMAGAFEFVVNQVGCSIEQAAVMAAATPARWHNLADVGTLEPGKWADICLVDDDGVLRGVLRRGEWVREVAGE